MSTKTVNKVPSAKKESPKKTTVATDKLDKKVSKSFELDEEAAPLTAPTEMSPEELEEIEEQQEEAAATSNSGNAAALAAAGGTTEMSASFKNFRHHPDMENFYRFIFENDLRHEALAIIDE